MKKLLWYFWGAIAIVFSIEEKSFWGGIIAGIALSGWLLWTAQKLFDSER